MTVSELLAVTNASINKIEFYSGFKEVKYEDVKDKQVLSFNATPDGFRRIVLIVNVKEN